MSTRVRQPDPALRIARELAQSFHGAVARDDLLRGGCTRHQLDRMVAREILIRAHPGVYLLGVASPSLLQRCAAAVLATKREGVVSHCAACWLYGIDVPGNWRDVDDIPTELTVTRGRHPHLHGVTLHRSTDLSPDQVTTRSNLPVTDPYRLAIDLGAVAPEWAVERAIEQLATRKLIVPSVLKARIDQLGRQGRRGLGVARTVMERRALGDAVPESVLEATFARLCQAHDLPTPVYQYRILVDRVWRRIDFAYPEAHIAIELQGYEFHSGRDAFQQDKVRTNQLQLLGWKVLQFTWSDVTTRPEYVASIIRNAIWRAEHP